MQQYLKAPVSNGNRREQALIRRWWHEENSGNGALVWEYYLEGRYADAVWFPNAPNPGIEVSGRKAPEKYPLQGIEIVLCEAKSHLTPELIGQALVYMKFACYAGARVRETIVFSETADSSMKKVAEDLRLKVVVRPLN